MLQSIYIKNYVLIEQLEIDFDPNMTVFTGETGAGKSITIGALSLALGGRGDTTVIGAFGDSCEVVTTFQVANQPEVQQWLKQQDMAADNELIIRRTLNDQGRSKLWINGSPVPAHLVRDLGRFLVQIHGQHDQIKLLNSSTQRELLDRSGDYEDLLASTGQAANNINKIEQQLVALTQQGSLSEEQRQLLDYQLQELHELDLKTDEYDQLHNDLSRADNAQTIQETYSYALEMLDNDDAAISHQLAQLLHKLKHLKGENTEEITVMLDEALINVQEAAQLISDRAENFDDDPQVRAGIEQRLERIAHIARKQGVRPELLLDHQTQLEQQLSQHDSQAQAQKQLQQKLSEARTSYTEICQQLSQARQQAAHALAEKITELVRQLGLPEADLKITVEPIPASGKTVSTHGLDRIQFTIAVNKGQSHQLLSKTASGGELSRICLAIEVVGQNQDHATFVFDEVDTGIGGGTAEKVGRIMRRLSEQHQVFAVTHLPQVAGQAHDHILVSKSSDDSQSFTRSAIQHLSRDQRIQELARMSGGETITEATLAQAEEFLTTG